VNLSIAGSDKSNNFKIQDLVLKRYAGNANFGALVFVFNAAKLVYRYPIQYESDEFIQRIGKFIALDLSQNPNHNLKVRHNTFYIDLIDNQLEFVSQFSDLNARNTGNFKYK